MANNGYDHDGDVSRFFLKTPPPESHLLAPPDDEPAASHVGAPQEAPATQMGVAAATLGTTTMPLNPDPAMGIPAPATNSENHPALAVDMQPPQAHGLSDDPAPDDEVMASNDPMPSFEALFDDIVFPNLETMSLNNDDLLFIDDAHDERLDALIRSIEDAGNADIGSGVAEGTAVPVVEEDEDYMDFVPFVRGELDCSNCRSVREMLHEGANHKLHFQVHISGPETFQHAIFDRTYIDANGQTILNEMVYLDLRQRVHEWVQNFIANSVEMLKNDTSGQLKDSCSTSSDINDPHRELEMDMLTKIFSSLTTPTEAAVAPQFAPEAPQPAMRPEGNTNADDILLAAAKRPGDGLNPAILESYQVAVQDGVYSVNATDNGLLAKQRKRISDVAMEDILKCIHMSKKDAAKELNISSTSLKRLCRKYNTHRWPARKFTAINNKIKKLQEAAKRHVGMQGLLAIKEKMDKLILEKAQLHTSVMKSIQENEKHIGGAGPSGSK
ncbi:unnamed protein product [Urochloa decumbens]|uniref:RWP-RK domain-containing protein n=1 Tax=Urochloa decumbens TaxID=240449 RepID=A0ABC8VD78_9POAL